MSLFFAKFCFLQFLRLQLTLASYRSYSLRFRFSLFYKSEISLLEISLCSLLSFVPLRSSSLLTRLPDFIRPKFRLLKFAFGSVSHKLRLSPICFCPQTTLCFAYRLRHPHIVAVLRFVAYSGSFHFTLRKFRKKKTNSRFRLGKTSNNVY